jgi:hypothetical protein
MAISSRREVPRLLLVVAGVQIPLLDASRIGSFTRYNLLTAEIQGFEENDKVHGGDLSSLVVSRTTQKASIIYKKKQASDQILSL